MNIAVSRFRGSGSADAAQQATDFSESLVSALRRQAQADRGALSPVIDVAGPESIGEVAIAGPGGQEALERLNATVGVSGSLESEPGATFLSVVIRVNSRQLHLAQQIEPLISQRIRMAGAIDESVATRIRVRSQLVASIDLVRDLLLGLGELESGHPARSRALLGRVLARWPDRSGREALHLLIGHTLALEHHYGEARRSYRQALAVKPGYARARFSLATLAFQEAAEDCSRRHSSAAVLRRVGDAFTSIAARARSTLRIKALFARARVDVCLSQAGLSQSFDRAAAAFGGVVDAYRTGTPDIRHEAAESLGWLAFIALPTAASSSRAVRAEIIEAVRYYRRAAALAIDPDRRRFFAAQADRWRRWATSKGLT